MSDSKSFRRGLITGFVGSMSITLFAVLIVSGVAVVTFKSCWERDRSGYYQVKSKIASPNGNFIAVHYERWIGTEGNKNWEFIDIISSNRSFDPPLSFRQSQYEFNIEHGHDVHLQWVDTNTMLISYKDNKNGVRTFQKTSNDDNSVQIIYQIITDSLTHTTDTTQN